MPFCNLSHDEVALILGYVDMRTIGSFRRSCKRARVAADSNALWSVLLRERAGFSGFCAPQLASDASIKAFARQLCVGRRSLDNVSTDRGADSSVWLPIAQCTHRGHLQTINPQGSAEGRGLAMFEGIVDDSIAHPPQGGQTPPLAVCTLVTPRLDIHTAAAVDAICRHILQVDYLEDTPAKKGANTAGFREALLAERFASVPRRFASLSLYRCQSLRDAGAARVCVMLLVVPNQDEADEQDARAQAGQNSDDIHVLDFAPATVTRSCSTTPPPAVHQRGANEGGNGSMWFDLRAATAANGRLFAAAMALSSSMVVVGKTTLRWPEWHARLRRGLRDMSEMQAVALRREEAVPLCYVTLDATAATAGASASSPASSSSVSFFDPLLEFMSPQVDGGAALVVRDPNWLDFGLVHAFDAVRGIRVGQSLGDMCRFVVAPQLGVVLDQMSGRVLSRHPLVRGSASRGGQTLLDFSRRVLATVQRAVNPVAPLSSVLTADPGAAAHAHLIEQSRRFYVNAMKIELDDAARPDEPFWVDVPREAHRVSKQLDKVYSSRANSSRHSNVPTNEDDDDFDENGEPTARSDHNADVLENDDEDGQTDTTATRRDTEDLSWDDFVPVLPKGITDMAAGVLSRQEQQSGDPTLNAGDTSGDASPVVPPPPSTSVDVPLDTDELFKLHERYAVASLRQLALVLLTPDDSRSPGPCVDAEVGVMALDRLRDAILAAFRDFRAANISLSRRYCEIVAAVVFDGVRRRFGPDSTVWQSAADPTRMWYTNMRDKIEEYVVKAKGDRKYDVLWHTVSVDIIPAFERVAREHGIAATAVDLVTASLSLEVRELTARQSAVRSVEWDGHEDSFMKTCLLITTHFAQQAATIALHRHQRAFDENTMEEWTHVARDKINRLESAGLSCDWRIDEHEQRVGVLKSRITIQLRDAAAQIALLDNRGIQVASNADVATVPQLQLNERERREREATGVVAIFNALQRRWTW